MKIVILAAGKSNYILDDLNIPKCLLKLSTETIIERQIRILNSFGIANNNIFVILGYKKELVKNTLHEDIKVIENEFFDTYDNTYSLYLGLKDIEDEVVVIDGDIVFDDEDLKGLLFNNKNVLAIKKTDNRYGETGVLVDDVSNVTAIGKHIENSEYCYTGIMKLLPHAVNDLMYAIEQGGYNTWYSIPLNGILKNCKIDAIMFDQLVMDINNATDYDIIKQHLHIDDELILVTGASGLLGNKLYHILKRNHNCIGIQNTSSIEYLDNVDLSNFELLESYLKIKKPTTIIHTAAIADPDTCTKNKALAKRINVELVENLCKISKDMNIKLIFISTDYVFDGELCCECDLESKRNPLNYYGETKVIAENIVQKHKNSLIIRIPIIFGYNHEADKITFVKKVIKNLKAHKELWLDNKQIRYPTLIDEIALEIEKNLKETGILHISSQGATTKYEWAKKIAKIYKLDKNLIHEDIDSCLKDRPHNIKLKIKKECQLSELEDALQIMNNQQSCAFKLLYKSKANELIYGRNVANYRFKLGEMLKNVVPNNVVDEIDCVMPVPTSGLYYAMGLAKGIKKPYVEGLIKPDKKIRTFQIADIVSRERYIREKIYPIEPLIKAKSIMLVDEAIFTGITLKVVCDMVKACGAKKIYIAIPTSLSKNKCHSYVQPNRDLLSQEYDETTINTYFKINGVFFQNSDTFIESLKDIDNVCYNCFV
ncbi:sugar nucleotide-binding protein [Desulfobacter curvatus]|uniref:sugar nucleotide-binding protein n=1 Tax=Desulfobacter curvatus TaxID=2290 RepID=UPI0003605058|nr:sugar nucleotide-binding protein [Desulfobacter curvatus]